MSSHKEKKPLKKEPFSPLPTKGSNASSSAWPQTYGRRDSPKEDDSQKVTQVTASDQVGTICKDPLHQNHICIDSNAAIDFFTASKLASHSLLDLKQSATPLWLCGANALRTCVSERVHAQAQRSIAAQISNSDATIDLFPSI